MIDTTRALEFPLYDTTVVRLNESLMVLSGSVSQHNVLFETYLDLNLNRRSTVEFVFEKRALNHMIEVSSGRDWHERVCQDADFLYSSDFYFSMENLRGYSSGRDSVSVIGFEDKSFEHGDILDWDRYFTSHLREVGIGFGEEGRQYAKHLIDQLPPARSRILMAALKG